LAKEPLLHDVQFEKNPEPIRNGKAVESGKHGSPCLPEIRQHSALLI